MCLGSYNISWDESYFHYFPYLIDSSRLLECFDYLGWLKEFWCLQRLIISLHLKSSMPPQAENLPKAKPSNLPKKTIEEIAELFAKQLSITPGAPLESVVEQLGGQIKHLDVECSADGSITVEGEGNFTIFLSPFTGRFRDRFTVAHELGHYVLHSRFGVEPLKVAREGNDRAEWEANWFAAALLMPQEEFTAMAKNLDLPELAYHFDVSTQSAQIRMESLGLQ